MAQRVLRFGDRVLGDVIEGGVVEAHRRRLSRLGHRQSIRPDREQLWASGEPAPRTGSALEVLIDGAEVLPAIERAVRAARSHVHLAGWSITPDFAMTRDDPPVIVRDLLADAARSVDVRVLLWAGAPVPVIRPDRRDVRRDRDQLVAGSRVRVGLDRREHLIHCHHEKIVVVDDELAFVGGLDLTDRDGDRFDWRTHPYRERLGWHDLAFHVRGPLVADIARHFGARWREVTGESLAPPVTPGAAGQTEAQFVRTVPDGVYSFAPTGDFRILESYLRAFRSAENLIYIENQFLWSPEIVAVLVEKLRRPPTPDFRLVVVLPARANQGQEDTRGMLQLLIDADGGAGRFTASTITGIKDGQSERIYVHAKVATVDDRWLTIGSANLNDRGLFNDTEANVVTHNPGLARETRLRLWAEHLERPVEDLERSPREVVDDVWRPAAREQRERADNGQPRTRRLIELPASSYRVARLFASLQGLVVDG